MDCPHCGASVAPGATFCHRCRKRVAGTASAPAARSRVPVAATRPAAAAGFTRPAVVTRLAALNAAVTALCLCTAGLYSVPFLADPRPGARVMLAIVWAILGSLAALYAVATVGLFRLAHYGWLAQVVIAVLGLLAVPLGTLLYLFVLRYLFKPGIRILFSGRSASRLTAAEAGEVAASVDLYKPLATVLGVVVILLVLGGASMGFALGIPFLARRGTAAGELKVVLQMRMVMDGEANYSQANAGLFDRLDCLAAPASCIPGYPPLGPFFLDPAIARSTTTAGYTFTFESGPPPPPGKTAGASPSSVSGYAYVAVPVGLWRARSFCGDASGRLCVFRGGGAPKIERGMCSMPCEEFSLRAEDLDTP